MKVHLLITYNDQCEYLADVVFSTLRVGFPTADVHVHINGSKPAPLARDPQPDWTVITLEQRTIHHEWINKLIHSEKDPFWICDGDIIFYKSVEDFKFGTALAGALVPEFHDEFTKTITRARLHPSLLRIDPALLLAGADNWRSQHPESPFNPPVDLVNPLMLPFNGRTYFHDTMSLAYHALDGTQFSAEQKDAYFHFHFGTFGDNILKHLSNPEQMNAARLEIIKNPNKGKGRWREQDEYFQWRQGIIDGTDVIDRAVGDTKAASALVGDLCRGDQVAMNFCTLWYWYCHGIDDLIDTLRDGRPRMSRDQMVSLFFTAALLYNHDFYLANRTILYPLVLQVTNTYRDSIAWENSSKAHLRAMADVFRTCGNEMYVMIALICGGEEHMRKMSMLIKETDWLRQHDAEGRPL